MTKVLLIDDEETNVRVLAISLRSDGYEVVTAYSGEEGLEVFSRELPDIVVTDIKMPGMDGGRVAENLSEDASTSSIPIIFLTGLISQDELDLQGGYIAGHIFIAKPFDIKKLTDVIESITV